MLVIPLCFAWHIFICITHIVHSLTHIWDPLRPTQATYAVQPGTLQAPCTHTTCPLLLLRPSGCILNGNLKNNKCKYPGTWFGARNKPVGAGCMCVCRDIEKMDCICSDLNSHVVLSGLQHKTFIINLWIEPF